MADGAEAMSFVTKTTIETFLSKSVHQMTSKELRETLKDPASGRPGVKLVELQASIWDELGVPIQQGRMAVNSVEKNFPDNSSDLIKLRDEFSKTATATYLKCLEDRRPLKLETEGKLPREIVLEFFDACNLKMDTEEVKEKLQKHVTDTGSLPDDVVSDVHKEVIELLGYDFEHGKACFEKLSEDFAEDREIAMSYQMWQRKASVDCLSLLRKHQKGGGELNVDDAVIGQLLEMHAREELDAMTPDERGQLLEKNAKKVQIFRSLPPDGRKRHVERLSEEEKLDLAKSEVLFMSVVQRQQQQRQAQQAQQAQAAATAQAEAAAAEAKKGDKKKKKGADRRKKVEG